MSLRAWPAVGAVLVSLAAVARPSGTCGAGEDAQPVGEIRGRVFDVHRGPAPGAVVEAHEAEVREVIPGEDEFPDPLGAAADLALGPPPSAALVAARALTAADGSFRLTGLRANVEYRVAVRPTAGLCGSAVLAAADTSPLGSIGLFLGPAKPLRLRVTGPGGAGCVAWVSARLETGEFWEPRRSVLGEWSVEDAATGADGSLALDAPEGGIRVTVLAPGVGLRRFFVLAPTEQVVDLPLADRGGGTISGVVRDEDARPVGGARLAWSSGSLDRRLVRTAVSDAEGRYRLEGLPSGAHALTRAIVKGLVLPSDQSVRWSAVGVVPGAVSTADVRLARGASVRGRVRREDGTPVARALVCLRFDEQAPHLPSRGTRTDAHGRFEFEDLLPSHGWVGVQDGDWVHARPPPAPRWAGCYGPWLPFQLRRPGAEFPVELVVRPRPPPARLEGIWDDPGPPPEPASLSGTVVDASGRPLAGIEVSPCGEPHATNGPPTGPTSDAPSVVTDPAGRFTFPSLRPNRYTLELFDGRMGLHPIRVDRRGARVVSPGEVWHDLAPGARVEGVVVRTLPTGEIGGTLSDAEGRPVAGATLEFEPVEGTHWRRRQAFAWTDRDGRFRSGGCPLGPCRASLVLPERCKLGTTLSGTLDARLVLPPDALARRVVRGTVLAPNGRPVPLARLGWSWEGTPVVGGRYAVSASVSESVRLYVSEAYDADGRPIEWMGDAEAEVAEGEDRADDIRLLPGSVVAGRVADPDGRGIAGAPVAVVAEDDDSCAFDESGLRIGPWALSDADGTFRFGGLHAVGLAVRVLPPGDWVTPPDAQAAPGATELRIVLRPGVAVSGVVRGENGDPFGTATLEVSWVRPAPGSVRPLIVDGYDGGAFSVMVPVDAESVTLRATSGRPNWPFPGAPSAVAEGVRPGTRDLVLELRQPPR